jgi:hypothetical protein
MLGVYLSHVKPEPFIYACLVTEENSPQQSLFATVSKLKQLTFADLSHKLLLNIYVVHVHGPYPISHTSSAKCSSCASERSISPPGALAAYARVSRFNLHQWEVIQY